MRIEKVSASLIVLECISFASEELGQEESGREVIFLRSLREVCVLKIATLCCRSSFEFIVIGEAFLEEKLNYFHSISTLLAVCLRDNVVRRGNSLLCCENQFT